MVLKIYKSVNISRSVFFSITIFCSMKISYVYKKLKSTENKYRIIRQQIWDELHTCRSPPAFTIAIIIFSADMKGSSCLMWRSITLGYTTMPSQMFCSVTSILSADRKASANVILLDNNTVLHKIKHCLHRAQQTQYKSSPICNIETCVALAVITSTQMSKWVMNNRQTLSFSTRSSETETSIHNLFHYSREKNSAQYFFHPNHLLWVPCDYLYAFTVVQVISELDNALHNPDRNNFSTDCWEHRAHPVNQTRLCA
jgi:hypothetical protein